MRISVIGSGESRSNFYDQSYELGFEIGRRGHDLVCGGKAGVMEAACAGVRAAGGRSIGILPDEDVSTANEFVSIPIATGLGNARNVLVVLNGDGVVAIDGSYGTLSEIAHALDLGRPVVGIDTHDIEGVTAVVTPSDAVEFLEETLG